MGFLGKLLIAGISGLVIKGLHDIKKIPKKNRKDEILHAFSLMN